MLLGLMDQVGTAWAITRCRLRRVDATI